MGRGRCPQLCGEMKRRVDSRQMLEQYSSPCSCVCECLRAHAWLTCLFSCSNRVLDQARGMSRKLHRSEGRLVAALKAFEQRGRGSDSQWCALGPTRVTLYVTLAFFLLLRLQ